jgi:HAD superfamily hydrolase (TIGR01509 family)
VPIDLVIFDLGRVLIRLCDSWRHAAQIAGVPIQVDLASFDDATRRAMEQINARYDCGEIDVNAFAAEMAPHHNLTPDQVIRVLHCVLAGPYPGAIDLLDELSRAPVATACLSNVNDPHWSMMLDPAGPNFLPLHSLTHRFASHLVRSRKPLDAIYAHVERETRVAPPSILFFDDLESNVAAAASRGWNAVRIEVGPDPIQQVREHLRSFGVLG